jgi:hypothetical protein
MKVAYFYGYNAGHDSPLQQGHFSASEALAVRDLSKERVLSVTAFGSGI